MSIKDYLQKIKLFLANVKDKLYSTEKGLKIKDDLYIILIIILVGLASFGLGKISGYEKDKTPISILKTKEYMLSTVLEGTSDIDDTKIDDTPIATKNTNSNSSTQAKGLVVASKSGTKYYYPWCSGVSRIREENKVWFNTIEEARATGLTPASNCTGLK
jgi:hypothetical protein